MRPELQFNPICCLRLLLWKRTEKGEGGGSAANGLRRKLLVTFFSDDMVHPLKNLPLTVDELGNPGRSTD